MSENEIRFANRKTQKISNLEAVIRKLEQSSRVESIPSNGGGRPTTKYKIIYAASVSVSESIENPEKNRTSTYTASSGGNFP
jgi:hypothetical protein